MALLVDLAGVSPPFVALVVVLLVELFLTQSYYRGNQALTDEVEAATVALDKVGEELGAEEAAVADLETKIAAIEEKLTQLEARRQQVAESREQLSAPRTDWALALKSILGADGPDVKIIKLVVDPGGSIGLTGSVSESASVVKFREHMDGVSEVLELGPLKLTEELELTATIGVK